MEPTGFLSKPADMEHHCVSRRCQLCRFTILPGEAVIADINGHLSTIFASTAVSHLDKGLRAVFRLCSHLCSHYKGQVPGYHAACLAYAYVIPSRQFLRAVAYEYEPGLAEDRRRRRRIRDLLADKIGQAYGFPLELCCMTADELVCMSAVHTIQQVWGARRSAGGQFDISRGLWADYVHIDGLRYVANLFDRPGLSVGGSAVLSVDKASLVDVLYVLEDHLGVRQLVFGHQQQDITRSLVGVTKKRDQWWRTIVLSPVDRKLEAKSDGLKIRAIRSGSEPDAANMTWSLPISPPVRDEICLLPYAPYSSLPLRSQQMTALDCNVPGVTGYSIGWAGNLMRIHAHHGGAGGEDLAVYRELGEYRSDVLWTHMPVEPGELISEIWVRYGGEYAHMAVMVRGESQVPPVGGRATLIRDASANVPYHAAFSSSRPPEESA
ncbi:hypothetical protein VTK73DRAFT_8652 [Phialemonium thermophilum]|uniref:Uncharacterized protein n=1 Tax=Phialemonium thermophilum TaxID=223376 RepID=A0ABR3XP48_9PEZI